MKTITAQAQGFKWTLHANDPPISGKIAKRGVYEPPETETILHLVKPGMTFVDVGANIGYFSLMAAKAMGGYGQVDAYEPEPDNYKLLERNIMDNGLEDIINPYQYALSNGDGLISLYISPTANHGDHRGFATEEESREMINVPATTGNYIYKNEHIDFIKCDVQGLEGHVLDGFAATIQRIDRIALLIEYWPWGLDRAGYGAERFISSLKQLGFSLYRMMRGHKLIVPIDGQDLIKFVELRGFGHVNLLCLKGDWGV